MHALKFSKTWLTAIAAAGLLAGCASNPAPVTNYSFGGSNPPPATAASTQPAPKAAGAQTLGLAGHAGVTANAGHANGTRSAAGYTVARGDTLYSIAFAGGMDVRQLAALNGIAQPYVIHPGQVLKLRPGSAAVPVNGIEAVENAPPPTVAAASGSSASTAPPASGQPSAPVFGAVTQQNMTAAGVAPAPAESTAAVGTSAAPVAASSVPPVAAASGPTSPPATQASVPTPPAGATRNAAGITWQWPATGKVIGGFQPGSGGDGAGLNIEGNMGDPVRAAASGTVVYSGNGLIGYGELVIIKHNDTYLSAYGHNSKRLVKEGDHVSAGQEIALMGASGAPRVELHFEIRKDGKPVDPLGYLPAK
jgi:lipoprotein NlpD